MIEIRHSGMVDTHSTQQGYNQLYQADGIGQRDSFYLWLISLLKAPRGSRLLDISCGAGRLVTLARRQGLRAEGVDFAMAALIKAASTNQNSGWVVGDGEYLPMRSSSYQYITHIGSLEHYQDPLAGIREIARVLIPGGVACILLPNSYGLLGNIKHVFQTGDIFDDGQPLQRYNTLRGWQSLLESNHLIPFKILIYELPWPRTYHDLIWYLSHPIKLLRLFLSVFVPKNLGNCLVYLVRRE